MSLNDLIYLSDITSPKLFRIRFANIYIIIIHIIHGSWIASETKIKFNALKKRRTLLSKKSSL